MTKRRHPRTSLAAFLAFALVGLGLWSVGHTRTPQYLPSNERLISGSLSIPPERNVLLEDVMICSCWQGPNGQAQKKVKFRITNNTTNAAFGLSGGPDGSLFLFVAYPDDFTPVLRIPPARASGDQILNAAVPEGVDLYESARGPETVDPWQITNVVLLDDLAVPDGWRAWSIPANRNLMTEQMDEGGGTFPTYTEVETLQPGESYSGEGRNVGTWTFYVPYPPEIASLASSPVPATMTSTSFLDEYFIVLGVAVLDQDGHVRGFAPTPPESQWTSGFDF